MWVSGSSLLQGMFVSTSEFLGVLSVLAHFVCRLAGVLVTCQIILKTPILRTDDPSSQHRCTQRKRCIERQLPLDTSLTLLSLFLLSPLRRREREKTSSKETLLTFLTVSIVSPHNSCSHLFPVFLTHSIQLLIH